MKKLAVVACLLVSASFGALRLGAATYTVTASQTWSAFSPQPTSADAIVVQNGAVLTVDVASGACASIQLGGSGAGNGTLTFQNLRQVTCAGSITLGDGSAFG